MRASAIVAARRALSTSQRRARNQKPIVPGHNASEASTSAAAEERPAKKMAPSLIGREVPIDEDSWTYSKEREDAIKQTEKWALITFVVTAPIAYGVFWYAGVFEDGGKGTTRRRPEDHEMARSRVETALEQPKTSA